MQKIPKVGDPGKVKALRKWGAAREGEVFTGTWMPAARPEQIRLELHDLPQATQHPIILMNRNTGACIIKNFELV
jgi:hypothetical protein